MKHIYLINPAAGRVDSSSALREKIKEAYGVKTFNATSEYKIGHTLYTVTTVFNPASKESLSGILKRLIIRESEKILGESGQ